MTRRVGRLLGLAAALVVVCGVAGDAGPTKQFTRPCELSVDAIGGGEIGVKAWSWGPLTMTVQNDSYLEGLLIEGGLGGNGTYSGPGRVGNTRLDFSFDVPASNCGPETCQYRLILLNGVYFQSTDRIVFSTGTQAFIYDTSDPAFPISEGTASLVVQFTDGGGGDTTEPEKTYEACHDGEDNDGDGLIDCADPNCKKMCP